MQYSIVNFSKIDLGNRIDAEYFSPKYLKEDSLIAKYSQLNIGDFAFVTDGQHGYHEVDNNSPISHLTAKNAKNWFANLEGADKIAKWVDDKNKRSSLVEGDLILSTRGTVGFCAFITQEVLPANIDQDVARIAINKNVIIPEYVLSYLNCKFGQDWIKRNSSGMVQQGLSLQKVRLLPVPFLDEKFQKYIKHTINIAYNTQNKAKSKYHQAQTLLLFELGLLDWKPKPCLSFVKNYSDTQQAGRFDAEYFQPKYDEIVAAVKSYTGGWDTAENILNIKDRNFSPKEKVEYKYIELANIGNNGEITGFTEAEGQDLPTRARRNVSKDDVIVSSIEGSLSSIALIPEEYNEALCSTGFYVVDSDKINSQTLLVLLKSSIGQEQLKKRCSGTILTAINKNEIGNIVLPVVSGRIQHQIQQKIFESFNLRKQSKYLLEFAKLAVEIAIEKDEKSAMQWLESQIDSIEGGN